MSGENKSSKDRLDDFLWSVDNYIKAEGVHTVNVNPEVELILNLTSVELDTLTSEECCEKAYCLYGYCNYVQSVFNKHRAKLSWCEQQLNKIVAEQAAQFDKYMKWEQKYYSVIKNDDFAQKLLDSKLACESRVILLEDKIRYMRKMSDVLLELSKRKAYP